MFSANESPLEPSSALIPSLVTSLREHRQAVLVSRQTNSISTFFKESEILSAFRDAIKLDDESDTAFETFHDNVPFSVYEDYLPFILRLFEKPCRMSSIENLR